MKKHCVWPVALLLVIGVVASPLAHGKRWVYLGNTHVDKNEDHKTIHVGDSERFHTVQLRVNGGPIEITRVVIHYGDGGKDELPIHDRIDVGGKTKEVELPGDHRAIDSVEVWCAKERMNERPEVRLYAAP